MRNKRRFSINILFLLIGTLLMSQLTYAQIPQNLTPQEQAQLLKALSEKQTLDQVIIPEKKENIRATPSIDLTKESRIEAIFNTFSTDSSKFNAKIDSNSTIKEGHSFLLSDPNQPIKQFGYEVFARSPYSESPFSTIPVGPDYILGPGDAITIRIWGKVEEKFDVTVDTTGRIFLQRVGSISVAGDTIQGATRTIQRELEKLYVNFQLDVSVSKLRSIKIFVLGEVASPGSYDVSSLSTLMMALYLSGGPTKMGSLREVKLIRNQRVIRVIDLYDYLLDGNKNQDPHLQSFDTIFIPVIGDVVKIYGAVKRPAIFESKGQSNAYQAIYDYAGGPSIGYYAKHIQIERIKEGEKRVLEDLKFADAKEMERKLKTTTLVSGDTIRVLPIFDTVFQKIDIRGNVLRPGSYEFSDKLTLDDILKKAGGVLEDTYRDKMVIYRRINESERQILSIDLNATDPKSIGLQEFDIIEVASKFEISGGPSLVIEGEVSRPGEYQVLKNMTIQDALFIARPNKTAYLQEIELIRGDVSGNKSVQLIKQADYGTVLLKENDQIFIREESEKFRSKIVNISGMIKYPGNYVIKDHETLKDIISRAGGYTENAFPKGLIFKRLNNDENVGEQKVLQEERKRLIYEKDEKALEASSQTQAAYKEALQFVTSEISINTNRVVIDVKNEEIVNSDNILLQAGDTILIPETPRVVQVVGGVQRSTSFVYQSGEDYKYYVKKAGGYSKYANPKQMLVIKANGSVVQGKTVIERGDYIYIPEEVTIKKDMLAFIESVTKILANVATTIILVNTL